MPEDRRSSVRQVGLAMRKPILALAVLGVAIVCWELKGIISPASAAPADEVDAVLVLAGGRGERLETALEVMAEHPNATLVISTGNKLWPGWDQLAPLCEAPSEFTTECVTPAPDNTKGEAGDFGELAEARGWQSAVLVTSEYHLERAALLVERCFDGDLYTVPAPASSGFRAIRHELFGTLYAKFASRSCT